MVHGVIVTLVFTGWVVWELWHDADEADGSLPKWGSCRK